MKYHVTTGFGIDGQELDGQSSQECFVLGYEFAVVRMLLAQERRKFSTLVHAANSSRIRSCARKMGRKAQLGPADDGWRELVVA